MTMCAADGMPVNRADLPVNRADLPVNRADLPVNRADLPVNRAMFGCTGTAEQDGEAAAPFPQPRIVALTARVGCPTDPA
jgi:hypothetical protein